MEASDRRGAAFDRWFCRNLTCLVDARFTSHFGRMPRGSACTMYQTRERWCLANLVPEDSVMALQEYKSLEDLSPRILPRHGDTRGQVMKAGKGCSRRITCLPPIIA